ncbi:uncharacterized protein LOC116345067 [Contarinia nasturtii]|uniref:uncharacterized protein LOC116345067 n=1 Tax=Contarinia nasturtii TaxID=265458 RepID=UPI0012D40916|nr:uncharacterized protein LOC116345067 [Contarinia nasturtii]
MKTRSKKNKTRLPKKGGSNIEKMSNKRVQHRNEQHPKRRRINNEDTTNNDNKMRLINLNIDCLENIFKYLEFHDLLSLANANKKLKPAIDLTFSQNYGKLRFKIADLEVFTPRDEYDDPLYFFPDGKISILNMIISLRSLRCFGHLITDFGVHYDHGSIFYDEVDISESAKRQKEMNRYIHKYLSTESVTKLKFGVISKKDFKMITAKKTFPKVKTIKLSSDENVELKEFVRLFPMLTNLKVYPEHLISPGCIIPQFPQLTRLEIKMNYEKVRRSGKNSIATFLRMNPQIQSLDISFNVDGFILKAIGQQLKQLNSLRIFFYYMDHVQLSDDYKNDIIHLSTKNITFETYGSRKNLPSIPLSCEQLEVFYLKTSCHLNSEFIDFLSRNSSITELILGRTHVNEGEHFDMKLMLKIPEVLPLIKASTIRGPRRDVVRVLLPNLRRNYTKKSME